MTVEEAKKLQAQYKPSNNLYGEENNTPSSDVSGLKNYVKNNPDAYKRAESGLTADVSKLMTSEGWMTDYGTSGDPANVKRITNPDTRDNDNGGGSGGYYVAPEPAAPVVDYKKSNVDASGLTPYQIQTYDPNSYEGYLEAQKRLKEIQGQKPGDYSYEDQARLDELYEKIMNPEAYEYDFRSDPAYRSYADQYERAGRLAMEDTMGQAAALTGGYGSTYSQSAAQQTYDDYMAELAAKGVELEDRAYGRYQDRLQANREDYALEKQLESEAYGRWNDSYSRWLEERENAEAGVEREYERGREEFNDRQNAQSDWYSRIMNIWETTGTAPSDADLRAAGMSELEIAAWKDYFRRMEDQRAAELAAAAAAEASRGYYYNPPAEEEKSSASKTYTPISKYGEMSPEAKTLYSSLGTDNSKNAAMIEKALNSGTISMADADYIMRTKKIG